MDMMMIMRLTCLYMSVTMVMGKPKMETEIDSDTNALMNQLKDAKLVKVC